MRSASGSSSLAKAIRLLGLCVLVGMAVVPPWQLRYSLNGSQQTVAAGYHPIWSPPANEVELPEEAEEAGHRINVVRLGIQLVVVLVLMNGGLLLLNKAES
jgi:hypothetical protein